jgi:hypothetical protein
MGAAEEDNAYCEIIAIPVGGTKSRVYSPSVRSTAQLSGHGSQSREVTGC